jgi:hypothetical protein
MQKNKIFKFEFIKNIANQWQYYVPEIVRVEYYISNSKANRIDFMNKVGVFSNNFLENIKPEFPESGGYEITEVIINENGSLLEEYNTHILELWKCAREHNSSIPSDLLDEMKKVLLDHYKFKAALEVNPNAFAPILPPL